MRVRKSWREKLAESKDLPKTLLIPSPRMVDAMMRRVPRGKLATTAELREALAREHGATTTCPLTTGIFAWIAAHAADEAAAEGAARVTPYWRTLKADGELNAKFPGGVARQRRLLAAEGHRVERRGARWFVLDFERALFAFAGRKSRARRRAG